MLRAQRKPERLIFYEIPSLLKHVWVDKDGGMVLRGDMQANEIAYEGLIRLC